MNLTTIPEPPKKFVDDGGHFYRYYDALADELDEDMVKSLKAQLDGILIFAGLFAGVNSAFLALTLPAMSADPADDTNALLLQLVTGGNSTIRSAEDLPSATFAPSPGIFPVNVLFSLSLTLALLSAFLAVLGQQWLVYYRKRSGGGAEHQRWEQLRRYLGAKRWRIEAILDDFLPGLLQLALLIFCIGFVAYLKTLSKTIYYVIMGPMMIAAAALLLMGIVLGNLIKAPMRLQYIRILFWQMIWILTSFVLYMRGVASNMKIFLTDALRNRAQRGPTILPSWEEVRRLAAYMIHWALERALDRSGENIAQLEGVAAKRVFCTSEDFNALIYTAVNLHGMTSKESIQYFLGDETVYERLRELWKVGGRGSDSQKVLAGAFSRAFLQLVFVGESAELLVEPNYRRYYSEGSLPMGPDPQIPHPLERNVRDLDYCIRGGVELLPTHDKDFVQLLDFCEILRVTLDARFPGSEKIEACLEGLIAKYSIQDGFRAHVISLVAWGVCLSNLGIVTPPEALLPGLSTPEWELNWEKMRERQRQWRQQLETHPEHALQAQQQRMKAVKDLVGSVGWEKPWVPTGEFEYHQDTVFALIEEAFGTYTSQSPQRRRHLEVWLLEQASVILTQNEYHRGWNFVLTSSVDLLISLHEAKDTGGWRDDRYHKDDCLRSTRILSQCMQAIQGHYSFQRLHETIDPVTVLNRLEQYLRLETDLMISGDDNPVLPIWLEIRDRICEAMEGPWDSEQTRDAYFRVKLYFDTIESAMSKIKVAPKADGDPADPPPIPAADGQAGPSGSPGTAVTELFGENAGEPEHAHRMQGDASECEEDEDVSVDSRIEGGGGDDQEI
ncbi:hypothetical protein FRC05_004742 [Tulasnella sp. 425]|nr:hypothetical protein FRC05_004742 [Tulasnella sp. 425]